MSGKNTPAFHEKPSVTNIKSFITLAPGVYVMKLFFFVTEEQLNKLEHLPLVSFSTLT
jgi:hypothetical protein